jgi:hypothetical protein
MSGVAPDITQVGIISTQNLNPNSGVATAGSTVEADTDGRSCLTIQTVGVYTGALTVQGTVAYS